MRNKLEQICYVYRHETRMSCIDEYATIKDREVFTEQMVQV